MKFLLLALLLVAGIAAALPFDEEPGDPQPSRACQAGTGLDCRTLTINCGLSGNNCYYCNGSARHAGCTGQEHQACAMGLELTSCGSQVEASCDPQTGACGAFDPTGAQCFKAVCL